MTLRGCRTALSLKQPELPLPVVELQRQLFCGGSGAGFHFAAGRRHCHHEHHARQLTERTREVGIRKALGARSGDVLRQFLIKSAVLSLIGGAIGILVGILIAKSVTLAIGMPSQVKLWSVLIGLLMALSVGIFFGVYPARKAARLDPISALRFEL